MQETNAREGNVGVMWGNKRYSSRTAVVLACLKATNVEDRMLLACLDTLFQARLKTEKWPTFLEKMGGYHIAAFL